MPSPKRQSALLLLAAFLIGGVAAPWLHRVQHVLVVAEQGTPAVPVGTDAAAGLWITQGPASDAAACVLCTAVFVAAVVAFLSLVPLRTIAPAPERTPPVPRTCVPLRLLIRGPPLPL